MRPRKASVNFMVYVNRSGSTYLSALLDSFPEIGITLESPILSYLLRGDDVCDTEKKVEKRLERIYRDPRFKEWGIPISVLRLQLISNLPLTRGELIYAILDQYFQTRKPDSTCWIYKGCSPFLMKRIKTIFPAAKFIFVYRDGRAVLCSKKKAKSLVTGDVMEMDPMSAAKEWIGYISLVEKHFPQRDVIWVKYENLILRTEEEMRKIYEALLGRTYVENAIDLKPDSYYGNIPESQKHLHGNVSRAPLKSRIMAWESEITYAEAYLFERTAGDVMRKMGYKPKYLCRTLTRHTKKEIRALYIKTFFYRCVHYFRRLQFYGSHPDEVCNLIHKIRARR